VAREKSGVHLTGADSGWPVGDSSEPGYTKNGSGTDDGAKPKAQSVAGGVITDATSANEVQTITPANVTGGSYKLTAGGVQSASIPASAVLPTAATVKTALEACVGAGNVDVTGAAGGVLTVTFKGDLGDTNVAQMTVADSTTGSGHSVTIATQTPGSP
jgi:hypothetical protein